MNVKQYVQDLDLSDGDKHRGKCPECSRSNTFTATIMQESYYGIVMLTLVKYQVLLIYICQLMK